MRRRASLICGAAALALSGCLTLMPVGSHVEHGTDFTRFQTFAWGPADALPANDPRLAENPFFVDDVHGAIDRELEAHGLRRVAEEPADLFVHYHAAAASRIEAPARRGELQDCVGDQCLGSVVRYDAGTLVIDLIDARTRRVVWRGWAEHRLEDMLDDPPLVRRRIDDAVHRIMERLP